MTNLRITTTACKGGDDLSKSCNGLISHHQCNYFVLQVLMPNGKYAGQIRKIPVISGTTPSHPHAPI